MENIINIGNRRELFWDDTMIDMSRTHSTFKLHTPVKRECVAVFDEPWGKDACNYTCVVQDGDVYRMYANASKKGYCYLESRDGIHWEKPSLGICEFEGSTDNNILFPYHDGSGYPGDGFRVTVDPRPDCPPERRYFAIANEGCPPSGRLKLKYYTSADGKHFTARSILNIPGDFDSMNTLVYDMERGLYRCFFRTFHPTPDPMDTMWIRDVSVSESEDLEHWSPPRRIHYSQPCDWAMYTNGIFMYHRAPHVYAGLPTRYIQRPRQWAPNYDELRGLDKRRERFETMDDPRYALALTDSLFMTSRDGLIWNRYNDAFVRPGPESGRNWLYGDVYIAGIVETPSPYAGCDNEISFYCGENRWMGIPGEMYRYSLRLDGFVSQHGAWDETAVYPTLVTKKFIFEGKDLFINFATSAYGHIEITLRSDDKVIKTAEIFGDSTHRRVHFEDGSPAELAGKPVVMEILLIDADIYSFKFE